jgi:hypothetical protein
VGVGRAELEVIELGIRNTATGKLATNTLVGSTFSHDRANKLGATGGTVDKVNSRGQCENEYEYVGLPSSNTG